MNITTDALTVACKTFPVLLKYQKFIDEEKKLLENTDCISKIFSPWATPVITVPKKLDPSHPYKQEICLVLDYRSLNKSTNTSHNGISVISYYLLPNIMDLLARLQTVQYFLP